MAGAKYLLIALLIALTACGSNRRVVRAEREMKRLLIRYPELYVVDSLRGVLTGLAPVQSLQIRLPKADTVLFEQDGWVGKMITSFEGVDLQIKSPVQKIDVPYALPYQKVEPPLQTQPKKKVDYWWVLFGIFIALCLLIWYGRSDPKP